MRLTRAMEVPPWLKGSLRYWVCQFGGWGALWLSDLVEIPDETSGIVYTWPMFTRHLVFYGTALLLTHAWRAFLWCRAWPHRLLGYWWWRAMLGTLVLSFAHVLLHAGWEIPTWLKLGTVGRGSIVAVLGTYLLLAWVEFSAWTGLYLGYHYYQQLQDLRLLQAREESARRAAKLESLRAQVNPHFLFNSLNTLKALITEDASRARDAVSQLAQLLRASLDNNETPLVPLAQELETISCFLELEKLRYESRLNVVFSIAPRARQGLIPPFLVQTLVENAIKHGIETVPAGGTVSIAADLLPDGVLEVRVSNPGRIVNGEKPGRGLAISRDRLRLLGGEGASLELSAGPDAGQVTAVVRFPQPREL